MDENGRFWGQTSVCVCVELAWKENIEHQPSTNQLQATTAGAPVRLPSHLTRRMPIPSRWHRKRNMRVVETGDWETYRHKKKNSHVMSCHVTVRGKTMGKGLEVTPNGRIQSEF